MSTSVDIEKHNVEHLDREDGKNLSTTNSEDDILSDFTEEEIRAVKHRIDRRLVTTVGFMYCISLMDRTNLSAAAIAGMTAELKLNVLMGDVSRYSVVTLVFFATYVVFQFPSTVVIRYLGPRNHLGGITFMWGAVMIGMTMIYLFHLYRILTSLISGMGFVKDFETLAALRVILGIFEAGFFPGGSSLLHSLLRSTMLISFTEYSLFYKARTLLDVLDRATYVDSVLKASSYCRPRSKTI
jgi:hypothetical protein